MLNAQVRALLNEYVWHANGEVLINALCEAVISEDYYCVFVNENDQICNDVAIEAAVNVPLATGFEDDQMMAAFRRLEVRDGRIIGYSPDYEDGIPVLVPHFDPPAGMLEEVVRRLLSGRLSFINDGGEEEEDDED